MPVLVYIEHSEGKFAKSAFEVCSYAAQLASLVNTSLSALVIGKIDNSELEQLGIYGASKVLHVDNSNLQHFVNQAYASIIKEVYEAENASVLVMANTFTGKGLAPRVAVKLDASYALGVKSLPEITGDKFLIKRGAFSGKAFAFEELLNNNKVLSLNSNSFKPIEVGLKTNIVDFKANPQSSDFNTIVKEIVRSTNKISLPEAETVVSAGRGLAGPENWKMVEELAEILGAATACSKPVSDMGWRPHSEHVGQTGISISPNLYIAIGISGAIQHLAGVSSSKVIMVINKDPEAPFFKVADYGLVGDAFEIIPKLNQALKALKS